jgi:hypothetical protein
MENDHLRGWIILVLIFFGILLVASLIILKNDNQKLEQSLSPKIINYYNSYETYNTEYIPANPTRTSYQTREERDHYNYYNYDKEINYANYRSYYGQERRKDFFGGYVQEYYVYVLNKEKTGHYFTVVFEFKDKNNFEYSESITQYLRAGEKKKFAYKDIQFERNEIIDWDYEVIPEDD